ncbi:hypothetical protein [Leuconostoc palmae]|uniref:hypothetical protein n=1 Tax=Leuconostoc palmae TaxID=501487 RepID=UPI001C7D7685|nr:hypothetical protein [Leuconostoc palmae]
MIKITTIEQYVVGKCANPKKYQLEDVFISEFHVNSKRDIAQFLIDSYSLGELTSIKHTSSKHILEFTTQLFDQSIQLRANIIYDV